jgi:hypothetical protein
MCLIKKRSEIFCEIVHFIYFFIYFYVPGTYIISLSNSCLFTKSLLFVENIPLNEIRENIYHVPVGVFSVFYIEIIK